jgi:hypothetical protein
MIAGETEVEDSLYPAKGNRGQQAEERNREIPKH